jgi:Fe-S cluster assembly iron-binding protein IscA
LSCSSTTDCVGARIIFSKISWTIPTIGTTKTSCNQPEIDEIIVYSQGVKIAVEEKSAKYLNGCIIDYVSTNGLVGGFKVTNPTSTKSCGCGKSFSTEDSIDTLNEGSGCGSCKS